MVAKLAVPNRNAPDMSSFFNWGLKLRGIEELFIVTGRPAWAADGSVMYPDDGLAQTRYILDDVDRYLTENGYSKTDLIRIEYTFTRVVDPATYQAIFELFAEYLRGVPVKPAASTLRIVEALGLPGLCVEYEFWCAK